MLFRILNKNPILAKELLTRTISSDLLEKACVIYFKAYSEDAINYIDSIHDVVRRLAIATTLPLHPEIAPMYVDEKGWRGDITRKFLSKLAEIESKKE